MALMHLGTIRAEGAPDELKAALGPGATLEDVFRHFTGSRWTAPRGERRPA